MAELGNLVKINFLAINESFTGAEEVYTKSKTGANNQLFMKFGKTDWDTSTEVGKLAEEVVNHLTAAELIKNKPLKRDHAIFLLSEAERMMKLISMNPGFGIGITTKPITTVMGVRKFKTKGMDERNPFYKSIKVSPPGSENTGSSWLAS